MCALLFFRSSASAGGPRDETWDAFLTQFPITVGALAPSKEDIVSAGFGEGRNYYFMWRHLQLEKRVLHVAGGHWLRLCQTDAVCCL